MPFKQRQTAYLLGTIFSMGLIYICLCAKTVSKYTTAVIFMVIKDVCIVFYQCKDVARYISIVFGQQWRSIVMRKKLWLALDTHKILVSTISSFLDVVLSTDLHLIIANSDQHAMILMSEKWLASCKSMKDTSHCHWHCLGTLFDTP